jgi:phage terminase small subunit
MGRRGPKPLPTAIKDARGTLRKCRTNPDEPQLAVPRSLEPPKDLKGAGRVYWLSNVRELVDKGVLRDADMPVFESCCRAWSRKCELEVEVTRLGYAAATATGMQNALLKWTQIHKQLAAEVGLTPSARSGVKAVEKKAPGVVESFIRAVK